MKRILSLLLTVSLIAGSSSAAFAASSAKESLEELAVCKSQSTSSSKQYKMYPKFDPEVLEYYVFLPDGKDEVYLYMEPDSSKYKMYCDGDEVEEDDDQYWARVKNIDDGDETKIVVKDKDGDKLDTYKVTYICGDDKDDDEALLDSLSVRTKEDKSSYTKVALNEKFDEDDTEYSVDVEKNDYDTVRIYAEASYSKAHVIVDGKLLEDDYTDVEVKKGENEFDITVVAQNCDDAKTYTLTVNYDSKSTKKEAALNTLNIKDGNNAYITLTPGFISGKSNYTAAVANSVQSVSFYMTATDDTTVTLNGTELKSSAWSQQYTLNEGMNKFTFVANMTGKNASKKTYTVNIFRHPANPEIMVSVQKLNIDGTEKQLNAYNINGNNFVKLRDIASLLSGKQKQFSVGYVNATESVSLLTGGYYTANGLENTALTAPKVVMTSLQKFTLDNQSVGMTAYNIDDSNYVMLRDIALLMNFGLTYDLNTDTVQINTYQSYTPN